MLEGPPPTPTTATGRCRRRTAPTATTSPRCTGTTRPPPPGAAPASRPPRPRRWTPAVGQAGGGYYAWEKGHCALERMGQPGGPAAVGPPGRAQSEVRPGPGDWMLKYSRNLCLYPNVYIMDQFGSADPALPPDRGGQDRGHHLLHRPEGRERRGPAHASASTRTSSTPAAWPPRTTSRSSAPARRPTWHRGARGTT